MISASADDEGNQQFDENKIQIDLWFSVARRGEFSRFVGFLAQKGGQIFEDGDLWD